jgi:hypothetical protein
MVLLTWSRSVIDTAVHGTAVPFTLLSTIVSVTPQISVAEPEPDHFSGARAGVLTGNGMDETF